MLFFLDTANLVNIKIFNDRGFISGVTTNPTLIAKEGVQKSDIVKHIKKIADIIDGPISVEVYSTDYASMVIEAKDYSAIHKNVVIKLPCTSDGLKACKTISDSGIKVNVTLVFSALQALLAAKSGAAFVSPFIGRLEDAGQNGLELISDIKTIFENYHLETKILSASFRTTSQLKEVALIGSHIATVSPEILEKVLTNIFTESGLEKFTQDSK